MELRAWIDGGGVERSRHLDEFIRDYLRANEPACPSG